MRSSRRGSRDIEYIGSAHDDAELEVLKAAARQRLAAGQDELDLGLDGLELTGPGGRRAGGPLPITSSRMGSPVRRRLDPQITIGLLTARGPQQRPVGDQIVGIPVMTHASTSVLSPIHEFGSPGPNLTPIFTQRIGPHLWGGQVYS